MKHCFSLFVIVKEQEKNIWQTLFATWQLNNFILSLAVVKKLFQTMCRCQNSPVQGAKKVIFTACHSG